MRFLGYLIVGTLLLFLVLCCGIALRDRRLLRLMPLVVLLCGDAVLFEIFLASRVGVQGSPDDQRFLILTALAGCVFVLVAAGSFWFLWRAYFWPVVFLVGMALTFFGVYTTWWAPFTLGAGILGIIFMAVSLIMGLGAAHLLSSLWREGTTAQNDESSIEP